MSSRLLKTLFAVSLALNAGFIATAIQRHWPGPETAGAPEPASLPQRLGLSADQRRAWDALEAPFLQDLAGNWAAIRAQRQALLDELFAVRPDRQRIADVQARIAALQDSQQKRVIDQLLAERGLLDEAQQQSLKDLLLQGQEGAAGQAQRLHQIPAR